MEGFDAAAVLLLGMILGSFATALSYRLPRDISIVTQMRSSCPSCQRKLTVLDLIPLLSWVFLKGKCRSCKTPIGLRYPLIELSTLTLCFAFYLVYGLTSETFFILLLSPVLISIVDIDLHYKIIPDSLNLTIAVLGLGTLLMNAIAAASPATFFIEHIGPAFGGLFLYGAGSFALRQGMMLALKKEALGLGDVKFFAAAGFWLGHALEPLALLLTVAGCCGVIVSLVWKKTRGEAEAPFGPSLIAAFIAVLLFYRPEFIGI
jgi:leader peptidase (prepilin peptidase) / N-methyltransferase